MNIDRRAKLKVNDLRSDVILGVTEEEREQSQEISINLKISYLTLPNGCTTDDVNDTLCYDTLCKVIIDESQKKPYKLIEHMASEIIASIINFIENRESKIIYDKIKMEIIKLSPPIAGLKSGASFSITQKRENA